MANIQHNYVAGLVVEDIISWRRKETPRYTEGNSERTAGVAWVVVHAVLLSVVAAYERPSRVAAGSDLVRPMLVGQAGEHSTRQTHVTHTSHTHVTHTRARTQNRIKRGTHDTLHSYTAICKIIDLLSHSN